MDIQRTRLSEVLLIHPHLHCDERGWIMETHHAERYISAGVSAPFVQENQTFSHRGVLRGLHYQLHHAQGKLIQVFSGAIFDVAVDIRRSSGTFGQWVSATLSTENRTQIWIPAGFAHGLYVLSESAEIVYKMTDYYTPQAERTILWNDTQLAIAWPLQPGAVPVLSPRDARGLPLDQAEVYD